MVSSILICRFHFSSVWVNQSTPGVEFWNGIRAKFQALQSFSLSVWLFPTLMAEMAELLKEHISSDQGVINHQPTLGILAEEYKQFDVMVNSMLRVSEINLVK